ncbi:GrpB family protein [Veronia pacifica]|uniref:GrpB family protein n=1 Tax=Veronia pacifica TaxID=1080227 RepID=A0A1C3EAK0_9GAMM|nr:GrpB family protein [Veronia pacifica]ODA30239.1 hypothetical protein A8L45_20775 [Veronia pacifica]
MLLELAGSSISRIEHIGSTSVPGLKAKPVIDNGIEVGSARDLNEIIKALPEDIYEYFGERDIEGDFFFAKGPESCRTHYIHVSFAGTARLRDLVKFRESLRSNEKLKAEYAELKEQLAEKHQSDIKLYTKLKGELIARVVSAYQMQPVANFTRE